MSSVALSQNPPPVSQTVATTLPADDLSQPVPRPKTNVLGLVRDVFAHGGPGYLQFAITNLCNADCGFCGFARSQFDPKKRRSVTLKEAIDVIDIAKRNHIGYLLFVAGTEVDLTQINPEKINQLVADAGRYQALGDYRPVYGRFLGRAELVDPEAAALELEQREMVAA